MRAFCRLFSILSCLWLCGCCENEWASEQISPDGKWKYVTFSRNCGATTGNNYQVSVLSASAHLPLAAGNAFIGDSNHGETSFVALPVWLPPHYAANHIWFKSSCVQEGSAYCRRGCQIRGAVAIKRTAEKPPVHRNWG